MTYLEIQSPVFLLKTFALTQVLAARVLRTAYLSI